MSCSHYNVSSGDVQWFHINIEYPSHTVRSKHSILSLTLTNKSQNMENVSWNNKYQCHRPLKLRTDGGYARCSGPRTWVHRSFYCNFFENEPIVTKFQRHWSLFSTYWRYTNKIIIIININSQLCTEYWLQISLRYDMHFPFYYGCPSSGWPTAITACAVAQSCCISDVSCQWEGAIFDPP